MSEFGTFARELMARMRECIERDRRITPDGIPHLPLSMAENETYKPQTGCATIARVAFHGEFAPDDKVVADLIRLIDACDNREGFPNARAGGRTNLFIPIPASGLPQILYRPGKGKRPRIIFTPTPATPPPAGFGGRSNL